MRIAGNVTPPLTTSTKSDPSREIKLSPEMETSDNTIDFETPSSVVIAPMVVTEEEMARYAVCLANDDNTQFYHKLVYINSL